MRLLILAQHYAPEEVSGAVLATDLATDLVSRGHSVTFVTCAPNYPQGVVFPGYRNNLYREEVLEGVRVIRTWSYISPKKSSWRRFLNHGTFSASAFYGGFFAGKHDVIFCYSPPLTLGLAAMALSKVWGIPWIMRVEDLYPDAAIAVGILKNSLAIKSFYSLEKFLYKQADHVSLISNGFRQILINKGVAASKLSVAPVWADGDEILPLPKENSFRKVHGLNGKQVVLYAGNLGYTSALEEVLEAARLLKEQEWIRFVIVGEGVKKRELMADAETKQLDNVIFLQYQPRSAYSDMMAAADISLVTLNPSSSPYSVPSKVFSIMASGRPILAISPEESEIARLIRAAECGYVVPPGEPVLVADTIQKMLAMEDKVSVMGNNGRVYMETHFSRSVCVDQYEDTLKQVLG